MEPILMGYSNHPVNFQKFLTILQYGAQATFVVIIFLTHPEYAKESETWNIVANTIRPMCNSRTRKGPGYTPLVTLRGNCTPNRILASYKCCLTINRNIIFLMAPITLIYIYQRNSKMASQFTKVKRLIWGHTSLMPQRQLQYAHQDINIDVPPTHSSVYSESSYGKRNIIRH